MGRKNEYKTVKSPNAQRQVAGYNPYASITVEDLKENREDVIRIIKSHTGDIAMVMKYMVSNINEAGNDVEEYTTKCLEDLGIIKIKFVDNSDFWRAQALNKRGSSMR